MKKISYRKIFFFSAFWIFSSCSGSYKYPQPSFINVKSGENLVFSEENPGTYMTNTKYISSGNLLNYLEPLTLEFKGRFALEEQNEDTSLEVHAYTSSMKKPDGFYLRFKPDLTEQNLKIFFFIRSIREYSVCSLPLAFSKNGEFHIKIQIQNSMTSSHFAVWSMYEDVNAVNFITKKRFNFNSADCSSQQNIKFSLELLGLGESWGLSLNYVEIKSIQRETPYAL